MESKFIRRMLEADMGDGVNGADNTSNADTTTTETDNTDTSTETTEKTFTQEDVNKLIQDRLTREQSKWEKKVQEEKTEAEKLAKMKADEKLKYQQEKREKELADRERELTTRELKAQTYETLAEKGIPKELVDVLNYESAETCNASIESVSKAFQTAVEKAVNEKLRGGNPQKQFNNSSVDTDKMSDDEYYKTVFKK